MVFHGKNAKYYIFLRSCLFFFEIAVNMIRLVLSNAKLIWYHIDIFLKSYRARFKYHIKVSKTSKTIWLVKFRLRYTWISVCVCVCARARACACVHVTQISWLGSTFMWPLGLHHFLTLEQWMVSTGTAKQECSAGAQIRSEGDARKVVIDGKVV